MPLVTAQHEARSTAEPSEQEIKQDILSMVWPVAAENVLQMLIGFVNTAMVGRLGAATILAVGLGGRVGMFVWIILGAVGTGATVLTARAFGARDRDQVRSIAWQGFFTAAALVCVVAVILYVFAPNLMMMFNVTPESLPMGVAYLRILIFSIPFQAIFMVVSAILRGMGNTRVPMQIAFGINIANVAVNSVLIFGRFGLPAFGFKAPAVATIVGQFTGALLAVWYLQKSAAGVGFSFLRPVSADIPLTKRLMSIGIPASAEMFFWQIASIFLFRLVNQFGTAAGAAYELGLQAEGISYMPSTGFAIAATAFVGRSLGAKDTKLAQRYTARLVKWGVVLTTVTTAVLVLGPRFLMKILTDDHEVITLGARYLLIMGLSQIPQQIAGTLGGSLRGAGDTVTPMLAAGLGIWGFRIPGSFLLSRHLGLAGIWWAINLDQYIRLLIVGFRYLSGKWKNLNAG